jgi:hypothetical protein
MCLYKDLLMTSRGVIVYLRKPSVSEDRDKTHNVTLLDSSISSEFSIAQKIDGFKDLSNTF